MAGTTSDGDLARAALRAFGAAVLGAAVWAVLGGPFGLTVGLVVVAAFVGWLIGSSARPASDARRRPAAYRRSQVTAPAASSAQATASSPTVRRIAVAAAIVAWALALAGIYVYSLAAIPALPGGGGTGTDLGQRIRETPILTFYAQSFGILDAIEGAILIVAAWWSSR
jgi:hypothetical protein